MGLQSLVPIDLHFLHYSRYHHHHFFRHSSLSPTHSAKSQEYAHPIFLRSICHDFPLLHYKLYHTPSKHFPTISQINSERYTMTALTRISVVLESPIYSSAFC